MEHPWESVLISVFTLLGVIVLVLLGARWGGWNYLYTNPSRWFSGSERRFPKSIQHALTQLEGVTEKRERRNSQTESEEAECPICLGYLYPKEVRTSTPVAADKVDLEAGNGVSRTNTTITEVTTVENKDRPMQPIDDDVLKMKRCTHIFHARCLATWFLRKKFDCPVCRTPYYQMIEDTDSVEGYPTPPPMPVVAFW
ncbi:hypothetical protein F4781DRAFT_38136 [Annulohypoxylon bovei var. microspora]|nr:hypothetical protein F4781DRAFT_38136 [Annulohypoxylon bovei var. microspora]